MSDSPSTLESRFTSATPTVPGRKGPTRTTACCASISRRVRASPTTPRKSWTWLPQNSIADLVKPSAGRRRPRGWHNSWTNRQPQVLRPPHEITRQKRLGLGGFDSFGAKNVLKGAGGPHGPTPSPPLTPFHSRFPPAKTTRRAQSRPTNHQIWSPNSPWSRYNSGQPAPLSRHLL